MVCKLRIYPRAMEICGSSRNSTRNRAKGVLPRL